MKKILAFSGSNSSKSINQQLVEIAAGFIVGYEVEVISLRDYEAPMYGMDVEENEGFPASMQALQAKFKEVDGFLVATPEHNGNVPAVFKNTIDWLSRMGEKVFQNKPVVFISTSPGKRGGASALNYLTDTMPRQGAEVLGHFALPSFYENVGNGTITNNEHKEAIVGLLNKW